MAEIEKAETTDAVQTPSLPIDVDQAEAGAHLQLILDAVKDKDFSLIRDYASALVQSKAFWIDTGLVLFSVLIAFLISKLLVRAMAEGKLPNLSELLKKIPAKRQFSPFRLTLVAVTWLCLLVANTFGFPCPQLRAFSLIITLFVFINLPAKFIEWKSWMSLFTTTLFVIAALHVLGLLDDVAGILDGWGFELGNAKLSVLDVSKGVLAFTILFWSAGLISRILSNRIGKVQDLSPNVKVLLTKVVRLVLVVVAVLVTLGVMGLKITTLAVFSGALGLGLGFGLQKVISNLVSGIILLLDKSIKPGDVVEIGETYGWINSLNLRYASIITRDNKEHLVPNEDLITNPVINWSYSSKLVRVKSPIGISYGSDVRKAMEVAEAAAANTPRVVETPAPRCNLDSFGDSSVNLDLRFWIEDPHNGVGRVRSEVLLRVWDAFHENGIQFPFPQRDVNFRVADKEILEKLLDLKPSPEKTDPE